MAKNKKPTSAPSIDTSWAAGKLSNKGQHKNHNKANSPASPDKPATLKDLLSPEILDKLKAQSVSMKAEEDKLRESARKEAEEIRKVEQKALENERENDFGQLLENSKLDWKKYK